MVVFHEGYCMLTAYCKHDLISGPNITRLVKLPRLTDTAHCLSADNTQQTTLDTPVAYSLDNDASVGTIPSLGNLSDNRVLMMMMV
jgi:hypothetical protein